MSVNSVVVVLCCCVRPPVHKRYTHCIFFMSIISIHPHVICLLFLFSILHVFLLFRHDIIIGATGIIVFVAVADASIYLNILLFLWLLLLLFLLLLLRLFLYNRFLCF